MHKGIYIFFKKSQIWLEYAQNNWSDSKILVSRGSGNGSDTTLIRKTATRRYTSVYEGLILRL